MRVVVQANVYEDSIKGAQYGNAYWVGAMWHRVVKPWSAFSADAKETAKGDGWV